QPAGAARRSGRTGFGRDHRAFRQAVKAEAVVSQRSGFSQVWNRVSGLEHEEPSLRGSRIHDHDLRSADPRGLGADAAVARPRGSRRPRRPVRLRRGGGAAPAPPPPPPAPPPAPRPPRRGRGRPPTFPPRPQPPGPPPP